MTPHGEVTRLLQETLKGWNVRHGDRPLDHVPAKPTVVAYTSKLDNETRVRGTAVKAQTTLVVFAPERHPDKLEAALFDAVAEVISTLNANAPRLTWDSATRKIYNDLPCYELTTWLVFEIERT